MVVWHSCCSCGHLCSVTSRGQQVSVVKFKPFLPPDKRHCIFTVICEGVIPVCSIFTIVHYKQPVKKPYTCFINLIHNIWTFRRFVYTETVLNFRMGWSECVGYHLNESSNAGWFILELFTDFQFSPLLLITCHISTQGSCGLFH